jgi:NADPH2 dehydrogenase
MYSANKNGLANEFHYAHYLTRAYGGCGLIIQEATAVSPGGRISENDLGIWDDMHISALSDIVGKLKKLGVTPGIQIAHAGRKSETKGKIIAPSPIKFSNNYQTPEEMTKADIRQTVENFKKAFIRAKKCGYEIIEIHSAHGYLLNQFLSPITNKRTDEYGGESYENRFRIVDEIIRSIREIDSDTPLSIRFSADEYIEGGNNIEDTVIFSKMAKEAGIDIIDVSSGGVSEEQVLNVYPGYQIKYSQKIKESVNIPTIAVGLITTIEQAEEILGNNRADFIAMGRRLLFDPYILLKETKKHNLELAKSIFPEQYKRAIEIEYL